MLNWVIIAVLKTIQFISRQVKMFSCAIFLGHIAISAFIVRFAWSASGQALQLAYNLEDILINIYVFYSQQSFVWYDLGCSKKTDKNPKRCSSNTNKASNFCQKCLTIDAEPWVRHSDFLVKHNTQQCILGWRFEIVSCCVLFPCALGCPKLTQDLNCGPSFLPLDIYVKGATKTVPA